MIAFLHHRYRTFGGEEHAVARWRELVESGLGEQTILIERDSAASGSAAAARGLLRGGLRPSEVAEQVTRSGARVLHAHNLQPTFGWRALAAAREAGARVVLHLHNYRLVCAVGTCVDRAGSDCIRCHGRNTLPGVIGQCRGSVPESLAYAAGLSRWQRAIVDHADVIVVPSAAARDRLLELGAPLPADVAVLPHPVAVQPEPRCDPDNGEYVLVTSRLAPEKGVDLAIEACAAAGLPLVVCGSGPLAGELAALAAGRDVRFIEDAGGRVIAELRERARVQLVPSRAAETFGLAACEAMAAGLPVVASSAGALAELGDGALLCPPGDADALACALTEAWAEPRALGRRAHATVAARCAHGPIAEQLIRIYDGGA